MKKISISAIDLFCGVGGLTHGLIKEGIPVKAGVDNDVTCRYSYEKNNHTLFINKSVNKVSLNTLNKLYGKDDVKVLVGCAPCQPFSKHTQKNKDRIDDEKWSLLYDFLFLIQEVRPDIVSMENVPQLTNYKIFEDFMEGLESLNYNVSWKIVFCPDYGIPQKRSRLVLLASKLGNVNLIPPTHNKNKYKSVRDAIGKLSSIKDGARSLKDPLHQTFSLSPINKKRIKQSKPGGTWRDWDEELMLKCHKKKSGNTYEAVYGRMEWDKVAPTITTQFYSYGTGRFGHPSQNRALSLREGALLQTFPKYYDFIDPKMPFSFNRIGKHIGNAVPVRLGKIIGKSINKHLRGVYE